MATPARRTSKTKKRIRRGNKKLTAPAIHFDEINGEYSLSHHVSPSGIYKEKPVLQSKTQNPS
ncbi:50S ribosomal protein L32 [Xylocopilactobacillus apicola]|uniref:Large ribosomal subunit protein bL32 n=1 Tax=Xylocopilactobacillus apicola TaxID=2932184 RepID=A0AAU9DAV7_9LACO|nr:50S ribosomal protein L32 [Xylocopilactobacillus apicola]BDR58675.1 50S ribosomal protein L32 [Xylocopilactobacillus apicola]